MMLMARGGSLAAHLVRIMRPATSWMSIPRLSATWILLVSGTAAAAAADRMAIPSWVFPVNPPVTEAPAPPDPLQPRRIPGSSVTFTAAQLVNLFSAPDWHPESHSAMPDIVAGGRPPDVYACGFCHMPAGQGRPENAPLAGLPADYIVRQVADFKSGERRSPGGDGYLPSRLMRQVAMHASLDDIDAAARYFSQQKLASRVVVVERARVPRTRVAGWIFVADPEKGDELLGSRLVELTTDVVAHENRDDALRYIAYAPPGSLERGRRIARFGSTAAPCVSCHGETLHGLGLVPSLAGRSPTYILRQLLAFQTGSRSGNTGATMRSEVAQFQLRDMIAVAAYAGSLPP